jgi:hypothetical protein
MVIFVAVTAIDADERLALPATKTVPTPGLNSKFVGAVRIKVTFVPIAKELLLVPSLITILPKVLYPEGKPEQTGIDRFGFVMVTCAFALLPIKPVIKKIKTL